MKHERQRDWAVKLQKCAQNQEEIGRAEIALEIAWYAKKLGTFSPDIKKTALQLRENTSNRLQYLFPNNVMREGEECLQMAQRAAHNGYFTEALNELQRGRELLRYFDHSELYLQLTNIMAEIYFQTARWKLTISLCLQMLTTWTRNPHDFQLLRALYYLTCAYNWLKQGEQTEAAVEEWTEKLSCDDACSKCVLLCIQLDGINSREEGVEQLYQKALQLDPCPSFMTIRCKEELAGRYVLLHREEEAEQAYLSACELYSAHYPHALHYARCLYSLGAFYQSQTKLTQAELPLLHAYHLYSSHFPQFLAYPRCIVHLAVLYSCLNRPTAAEELYQRSMQLAVSFANGTNRSACIGNWRRLYEEKEVTVYSKRLY
jgi:tetratricopeptide (TPR) repeat protein